ncbi:hypothetical protein ACFXPY_17615 [Streptomyces sp. NPDC059153]|uniref:hypothetical protein n=1 Tax=unclassified Streptomyces TaxID=2593676 RepID=UPI0036A94255
MQWEVEALETAELRRLLLAAVGPYIDRTVRHVWVIRASTLWTTSWPAPGSVWTASAS